MFGNVFGVLLIISGTFAVPANVVEDSLPPDIGLNTIQMIQRQGYPVEQHINIQTPDGYLLDLHRIPYGKNNTNQVNRPVVLLMHGLLSSSADWVNMGPEKSLSYLLAEAGYDVWMGNARGTTWSRKHIIYNPNIDWRFWDFSWHEIGTLDLPTLIDYILGVTGQEQLFYIGHSQGTTSFFVMASERPQYNAKIRLMVALAPAAYMSHVSNPFLQLVSLFYNSLEFVRVFLGLNEFLPNNALLQLIGQIACNDQSILQDVCASIFFLIGGWDSIQFNQTMIPVILTNVPAGSSTKQLLHYVQGVRSAKFRQYDYGLISNIIKYGSTTPPNYKINNIVAPVGIYYSLNDWMVAISDVNQLSGELPNVVSQYLVPFPQFNHLDFLYAIDVVDLLYNHVLSLLESH